MPSPILIVGDQFLSKNNVISIKKKYDDFYRIVTISASELSIDEIRTEVSTLDFLSQPKIVIINDLPNQKAVREAILELAADKSDNVKLIIWDSTKTIKFDPKTKISNKTWGDFINQFNKIPESKFINNGAELTEKDDDESCINIVKGAFEKNKKIISDEAARIFVNIVGKERGLLLSEVNKLSLNSPEKLSTEFILDNTFPTSKDAVLFKFGNALDGSYNQAMVILDQFIELGINQNVLGEIIAKKARWQLAACYFYSLGMNWYEIDKELMNMGKFPSVAWCNKNLSYDQKQKVSQDCETQEGFEKYKTKGLGLPTYYFLNSQKKKSKKKDIEEEEDGEEDIAKKKQAVVLGKKEVLPMPFLATQITTTLQNNFVKPNIGKLDPKEIRAKLLDRALRVYLDVVDKLKEIRYGDNPTEDLYEMVETITDRAI